MRARKCATLRHKRVGRERVPDTKTFICCRVDYTVRKKKDRRAKGEEERKKNEKKVGHRIRLFEYRVSRSRRRRTITVASGFTTSKRNFVGYEITSQRLPIALRRRSDISSRQSAFTFNRPFDSEVLSFIILRLWKSREKGRCTKTQHALLARVDPRVPRQTRTAYNREEYKSFSLSLPRFSDYF